jgi:hypothetical protein
MTCDSDYYNSEQNMNAIYLPKYNKRKPLYIGFSIQAHIKKQLVDMVVYTTV